MTDRDCKQEPTILTFHTGEGEPLQIVVDRVDNVMTFARDAAVPGVLGRCGGFATCGTCHMYVEEQDPGTTVSTPEEEADVIAGIGAELRSESRLTCQIVISPGSPGLSLRAPE